MHDTMEIEKDKIKLEISNRRNVNLPAKNQSVFGSNCNLMGENHMTSSCLVGKYFFNSF